MGGEAARPGLPSLFVNFLELLRLRSECGRTKQSCLVTDGDHSAIYCFGYNGRGRKESNGCSSEPGKCGCVHAETNALVKIRTERSDLRMYCTQSPCELCARLIVNTRQFVLVTYLEEYRDPAGIQVLERGGVMCRKWNGGRS